MVTKPPITTLSLLFCQWRPFKILSNSLSASPATGDGGGIHFMITPKLSIKYPDAVTKSTLRRSRLTCHRGQLIMLQAFVLPWREYCN